MDEDSLNIHQLYFQAEGEIWQAVIYGVIVLILLFLSGLISGSEVAFFSLSPKNLDDTKTNKSKKYKRVFELLLNPKKLLATILIANNLINVGIVIVLAYLLEIILPDTLGQALRLVIEIVGITFILLLFGEVIPKVYANHNALKYSIFISGTLKYFESIFSFISIPLLMLTKVMENKLGNKGVDISISDIGQALELTSKIETSNEEQKILKGIVAFGNTQASQVMTPRVDMFCLNEELSFCEVLKEITDKGFSRVPVFRGSIDQIIGVLYAKDLLPYLNESEMKWSKLLRGPMFIPENKKIGDLLREFQEKKVHLTIVVDEYGGTSGLVTLEDIIEEIVGEISDEYDEVEENIIQISESIYLIDGKTPLVDLYKIISVDDIAGFEEKKGEAETIAGLLIEIAQEIPKKGQNVIVGKYKFVVLDKGKKRIKKVKLFIEDKSTGDE